MPLRPSKPDFRPKGRLLIIGGHEDKKDKKLILLYLAQQVGSGSLVVLAVASDKPEAMWKQYERSSSSGTAHLLRLLPGSSLDIDRVDAPTAV